MTRVLGRNITALREHHGLSERQAARRISAALGASEGTWRHALRRIERREVNELDEEDAQALADALGVDVDDLGETIFWVWHHAQDGELLSLGAHILAFTDPAVAFNRRDQLGLMSHGRYPVKDIDVRPHSRDELLGMIGDLLRAPDLADKVVLTDIDAERLSALLLLDVALQGQNQTELKELAVALDPHIDIPRTMLVAARHLAALNDAPDLGHGSEPALLKQQQVRILHHMTEALVERVKPLIDDDEEQGS
jgi:transcriptional regulator with XRE-family HTH domain